MRSLMKREGVIALVASSVLALVLVVVMAQQIRNDGESGAARGTIAATTFSDRTEELARRPGRAADAAPFLAGCLAMLQLHHYESAEGFCTKALALDPSSADGYRLRGAAHLANHFYSAAIDDFGRAITLEPANADGYALRASAYREQGNYGLAVEGFSQAIQRNPSDSRMWNGRCWVRALAGTDLRLALQDCRTALRLKPDYVSAMDSMGFVFLRLKDFGNAARSYSDALAHDSTMASSFFGRGIAKFHLFGPKRAQPDIRTALKLDVHVVNPFVRAGIVNPEFPLLCEKACPSAKPSKLRPLHHKSNVRLTRA